jgi:3-oxoacyl-[acyl-carrier protein] reductase
MNMVQGKTAVVTGGSRGIGRVISLKLAENGADIAMVYYGPESAKAEAEATEAEIRALGKGTRVKSYFCNVADFEDAKKTVESIIEDFGGIDILINNAGITKDNLIVKMSPADFDAVIGVNLKGTFNMIKNCYSHFMKKRAGRIVNIASVSGLLGTAGQANYASSKAGIIGLTKVVARELGGRNVTCNAIAPGFIETDMTAVLSEEVKAKYAAQIPMKRYGSTEDVANLALFLVSDMSTYITGQTICVDGGLVME